MGGKGRRRREKNFLAAHGGASRLPPPPNLKELDALPSKLKELDALPSKLRKIVQLKNQGSLQNPPNKKRKRADAAEKKANPKDAHPFVEFKLEEEDNVGKTSVKKLEETDATTNSETRKRKRNKKTVEDLRFQNLDKASVQSRRKERRREYFESKNKKRKNGKMDDIRNFPGREQIKFGDIVDAPPKLSFPKAAKTSMDASKERIRLQAVQAYRNRRGWTSRPGVQIPQLAETPSL